MKAVNKGNGSKFSQNKINLYNILRNYGIRRMAHYPFKPSFFRKKNS